MVLNDQGGSMMSVSYDVTATLRAQEHGHPPLVLCINQQGGQQPMITENITATLTAGLNSGNNSVSILEVWDESLRHP